MYGLEDVKWGLAQPQDFLTELNRLYYGRLHNRKYNPHGIDIFSEDWDNLIILDACRYDYFVDEVDMERVTGPLETRISRGSATREWVRGNFGGRTLRDVVYIDSNGYFARLKDEIEAEVYKYKMVENDAFGGTSVHPDKVTDAAEEASEEYPNKRLLIHYMQPHQPFFGPMGEKIDHAKGLPPTVRENDLSDDEIARAYRENLAIALESAMALVDELEGKTVISADHGELLGDGQRPIPARHYGHPARLYTPTLVEVPWLIDEGGTRREIQADEPEPDEIGLDSDELDQRLQNLGYKT